MSNRDDILRTLVTVRDYLRWGASRFRQAGLAFGHGSDNALTEASVLVAHALHLPAHFPDSLLDAALTSDERAAVLDLLQRRIDERIPAPYLTGEAWFAGLPFFVDRSVLIPRSPIAELIETGFSPWIDPDAITKVLDLCTGSGCIAVASALALPQTRIDAGDVSTAALAVARRNVERHRVQERVRLVESDLFANLGSGRYDVIVSNPPYVDAAEMAALPAEYRHEPALGLDGGDDGLAMVIRILEQADRHLKPGGILIVEVGASKPALIEAYPDVPFTWLEFERGGDGVFLLHAEALAQCRSALARQQG